MAHAYLKAQMSACAGNSQHIQTLITFTGRLMQHAMPLGADMPQHPANCDNLSFVKLQHINEFLFATSLDNINMFQLIR